MQERPLSVGFLLRPGFTLVAFSGLLDVLRLAADEGDGSRPLRCRWTVLGSTQDPIQASCGVRVLPDEPYGDPRRFDVLVVVGGLLRSDPVLDAQTRAFVRAADKAGRILVGLCTGSITLLRAGLLDDRKCCLHNYHLRDVEGRFPRTEIVADQLFVVDGRYVTCAGGAAVADVGAWLVERQFGRSAAQKCMDLLLLDGARAPGAAQPQPPAPRLAVDNRVRRAMLLIEQSISEPMATAELARKVALSSRQLERLFQGQIGMPIQHYARHLRLCSALWMLVNTGQTLTAVANACGFVDASHFTRACRTEFGQRPSAITRPQVQGILERFQGRMAIARAALA